MRRILAAVLGCAMALSLAACGSRTPTAEELVSGGWPEAGSDLDASVTMTVAASISGEEMGLVGDELPRDMSLSLVSDVRLTRSGNLSHGEGSVTVSMFGSTYDARMDEWTRENADGTVTTYSYDSETEEWVSNVSDVESPGSFSGVFDFESDAFSDLAMTEEDGSYVVQCRVDASRLEALGLSDVAASVTGAGVSEGAVVDAVLTYDASTRALTRMTLTVDPSTVEAGEGVTLSELVVDVVVNATSGVRLKPPADIF